jgi:hypothetical protein
MGDSRRFDVFADLITRNIPLTKKLVDVAGGSGALRSSLSKRGYTQIDTWDKVHSRAKGRTGYVYSLFDWSKAPGDYGAVVAMHPDGGTDHSIMYAIKYRVPFIVCPCCAIPSAFPFGGHSYEAWVKHLHKIAEVGKMNVVEAAMPMRGRNVVLIGRPR